MAEQRTERFSSTGSQVLGWIGLAAVAVAVVLGIVDRDLGYAAWAWPLCGLVAVVLWVALVRPSVTVERERLVLRNMLETVTIPMAAIEQVGVGQMIAVRVGDKRYTGTGISRSRRQSRKDSGRGEDDLANLSPGGLLESRIGRLAEDARAVRGVRLMSDEQAALAAEVRREPARVEIALLAVLAVAFVVALVL
ncbi:hypothetical protein [Nocardioides sp. TF02-7]|uniref:hypothetical protein n=1 Tax=Nocardioides sp. TF02-7 TaxID=2917724 RepID=UPI001F067E57|nr:hypothetical protein [Nocardioides sp. TF02-7]UMG93287.1 hypothetical protein MF408_03110 [Nocardioides sp. TF02-7]